MPETSLLSTRDSLSKTPKGTTSISNRDSSPLAGVQNDNSGRVSSNSKRDSSVVSLPQNDKLSHPQGKLVCHYKHCEETQPELPATLQVCHSEGGRSPTEESLKESLVAHRDSSPPKGGSE